MCFSQIRRETLAPKGRRAFWLICCVWPLCHDRLLISLEEKNAKPGRKALHHLRAALWDTLEANYGRSGRKATLCRHELFLSPASQFPCLFTPGHLLHSRPFCIYTIYIYTLTHGTPSPSAPGPTILHTFAVESIHGTSDLIMHLHLNAYISCSYTWMGIFAQCFKALQSTLYNSKVQYFQWISANEQARHTCFCLLYKLLTLWLYGALLQKVTSECRHVYLWHAHLCVLHLLPSFLYPHTNLCVCSIRCLGFLSTLSLLHNAQGPFDYKVCAWQMNTSVLGGV